MDLIIIIGLALIGVYIFALTRAIRRNRLEEIAEKQADEDEKWMRSDGTRREPYDFTGVSDVRAEYNRICEEHDRAKKIVEDLENKQRELERKSYDLQEQAYELDLDIYKAQKKSDDIFDRILAIEESPELDAWLEEHESNESNGNNGVE